MKTNNRKTRINDEIQREISAILRDIKDPRVSAMTSVLKTETTSDLSSSKIYVSVFGADDEQKKTMDGLKSAKGFIRKELAHRLNLRNTPELTFVFDDSIAHGAKINQLIDEANRE